MHTHAILPMLASFTIASAHAWLDEHIGDTAEDPGYFGGES